MATVGLQIIQVGIGATPPDGITMDAMSKANATTMLSGIVVEDRRATNSTDAAVPDARRGRLPSFSISDALERQFWAETHPTSKSKLILSDIPFVLSDFSSKI